MVIGGSQNLQFLNDEVRPPALCQRTMRFHCVDITCPILPKSSLMPDASNGVPNGESHLHGLFASADPGHEHMEGSGTSESHCGSGFHWLHIRSQTEILLNV